MDIETPSQEPAQEQNSAPPEAVPVKVRRKLVSSRKRKPRASKQIPLEAIAPKACVTFLKPSAAPFSLYRRLALGFACAAAVLILALIYFSFPEAHITIQTKPEPISATFLVTVPSEGFGGVIGEKIVEDTRTFETSTKKVLQGKAAGLVTIFNNFSKNQSLVATTRLLTPEGMLFRIAKSVLVPAKGKVEVLAMADKPGGQGEIGPTKFTIPGLWIGLQDKIYAQSFAPMSGATKEVRTLTSEDIAQAKKTLEDELSRRALALIEQDLGKPVLSLTEIKKAVSDTKIGVEANSFKYTLGLEVKAILFDRQKFLSLGKRALEQAAAKEPYRLLNFTAEDSLTSFLQEYDAKHNTALVKGYLEGRTSLAPSSPALSREKIAGFSKQQAITYLQQFPEISKVEIKLYPFWSRNIPLDTSKIILETK